MHLEKELHPHQFIKENNFLKKLIFYFTITIFSIVISFIVSSKGIAHSNLDSARYMVSTLIQSEGAILAIIITLSLVAVQQTASTYSTRVTEVFKDKRRNPDFWILLTIYIGSMIYETFILKQIGEDDFFFTNIFQIFLPKVFVNKLFDIQTAIWFTFFLSGITFVALGMYINSTMELLNPSKIIEILSKEITERQFLSALDEKKTKDYDDKDPIHPIADIISHSLINYDSQTAKKGLISVQERTKEVFKSNNFDLDDLRRILENSLSHFMLVGKLALKRDNEDFVLKLLLNLHNICDISIKQKLLYTSVITTEYIGQIGKASVEQKMYNSADMAINLLKRIAETSIEQKKGFLTFKAINALNQIARTSTEQKMVPLSVKIVDVLVQLGDTLIELNSKMYVTSSCNLKKIKYGLPKIILSLNEIINASKDLGLISLEKEALRAREMLNQEVKIEKYGNEEIEFFNWVLESYINFKLDKNEEALKNIQRALDLKINSNISDALILKGDILLQQNRNYEASEAYKKAYDEVHKESLNNIISLVFKGISLSRLGRYDESFFAYEKAIELSSEDSFIYYNKGSALFDLGKYKESSECCLKSLKKEPNNIYASILKEVILQADPLSIDPELRTGLHVKYNYLELFQIGNYLLKIGRFSEASVAYEKVIEAKSDFLQAWLNKGLTQYYLKKFNEAINAYDRALSIKKDYATAYFYKGNVYFKIASFNNAHEQFKSALEIYSNEMNPDQLAIAEIHNRIGDVIAKKASSYKEKDQSQKLYDEAIPEYTTALIIRKQALGSDHPLVAQTLQSLAFIYERKQKYEEAEPLYKHSLRIFERVLDPNNTKFIQSLDRLADLYIRKKDYKEALPLLKRGYEIREQILPPDHPKLIDYIVKLLSIYESMGRFEEAYYLYLRANNILEQSPIYGLNVEEISHKFARIYSTKKVEVKNFEEFIKLTQDSDTYVRKNAVTSIGASFEQIQDKQQAWEILHNLAQDKSYLVRYSVANAIGSSFLFLPDKQLAWEDLHKLTQDESYFVRSSVTSAIGSAFISFSDKLLAWEDLHKLTQDESYFVRSSAVSAIRTSFSFLFDKQQAWGDIHRLTSDDNSYVRWSTTQLIGQYFRSIQNTEQAWSDLQKLTFDEDSDVKEGAAYSLGSAFPYIPNKVEALNSLFRLTTDKESGVREGAAYSLGSAFQYTNDEENVYEKLLDLAKDEENGVKAIANYQLGRLHIYKASKAETEDVYKTELKNAIKYFEISLSISTFKNPSKFCLPFYRSFYTIVFQKEAAEDEVNKYLTDAKSSIGSSKNKALLLEAVENLANALKEVKSLEYLDLTQKKNELYIYRKHCENVIELSKETEKLAPSATRVITKGLPIIDKNLKERLDEMQEQAKVACRESIGTATQEIACAINKEVQKWEIGSQEEMTQMIEGLIEVFRIRMPQLPGYENIFEEIEGIRDEKDLIKQYKLVSRLIGLIPLFTQPDYVVQDIKDIKDKTIDIRDKLDTIDQQLNSVRFYSFKYKLNSHNVIENLDAMTKELEKLNKAVSSNSSSLEKLDPNLDKKLDVLNNDMQERLKELEYLIGDLSEDEETKKILSILNEVEQSKISDLIQTPASVATLIGFMSQIIQLFQQYKRKR